MLVYYLPKMVAFETWRVFLWATQYIRLKEITHLRHFFENIVNNFHNTVFHSLFRNTNYFRN